MNCLIINGSYRKKGNTSSLIAAFAKGIKDKNSRNKTEIINISDKKIGFCKGCSKCFKDDGSALGNCQQKDDVRKILEKMLSSDVLVFASPIYEHYMTALMKKFIERSAPAIYAPKKSLFPFPRSRNKVRNDKTGVAIVVSGAPYPVNYLIGFTGHALKLLKLFLKVYGAGKRKVLQAGGMENKKLNKRFIEKAYKLGFSAG